MNISNVLEIGAASGRGVLGPSNADENLIGRAVGFEGALPCMAALGQFRQKEDRFAAKERRQEQRLFAAHQEIFAGVRVKFRAG